MAFSTKDLAAAAAANAKVDALRAEVLATGVLNGTTPAPTPSLSVGQPTATRIYQRDTRTGGLFGKGAGAVAVSVTLSASVTTLDFRLRDADVAGNPVRQDWTPLGGPLPAGTAALIPTVPASPYRYLLDVRANGDTNHAVLGTQPFGVGEVVAVAGQSLAVNALVAGFSPEGTIASAGVTPAANGYEFAPGLVDGNTASPLTPDANTWAAPADGTAYSSAFAAEFLRLVTGQAGVVAALIGFAQGSTSVTAWQPGQPLYATLQGILDHAGKFGSVIWIQGHSDAQAGMAAATYQGQLASLFTGLASRYAGPGGVLGAFSRLICTIPSLNGTYWGTPAQVQAIRSGALAYVARNSSARYVAALDMTLSGDGTHPNQVGRVVMARHFYRAFMGAAGLAPSKPGPAITAASRAAGSAVVKLTVAQGAGGTALVAVGTPVDQFTVYPAGSVAGALAIASLSIASATEINLTLAAAPADSQALDVWYRLADSDTAAVTGSGIYDNATDGDGLTAGRQLQLAPAAVTVPAVQGSTPAQPATYTFTTLHLDADGSFGVMVTSTADGSPVTSALIGLSTSATTPPLPSGGTSGGLEYEAGTYYDNGQGAWTLYRLGSSYSPATPAGSYYLWAKTADGVDRLCSATALVKPGTTAPDNTLTGLPSTIVAGQPLSAVTYTPPNPTLAFMLHRVATGANEGLSWLSGNMPGKLNLLIPQNAGAYTVRSYAYPGPTNDPNSALLHESAQFDVTAAPGALPATPTQTVDTGATSTGVTTNWTSTAASYRVLARNGTGSSYGSLVDTTVSTNSYTFTGLAANSSPRTVVISQNANGYGIASAQFISGLGSG